MTRPLHAIILAAGKGTRMKSDLPKVVHPVGGRPMVCAVVDACIAAGCARIVAIVGYKQEAVREALASYGPRVEFAVQGEQLGTGHAVQMASPMLGGDRASDCLVLCGDGPLIRSSTIAKVMDRHRSTNASATLATAVIDDPTGYGRIVRDSKGRFQAIVEQKNATPEQLKVREVNPSYYCFHTGDLFDSLGKVTRNALTGEYYLTDVPALLLGSGKRVEVIEAVPPEDVLSINTLDDLGVVDRLFRARTGVTGGKA
ncbi:MAG: sugar phosphate nucleotidyltransferase [Phycisphaerales bacterium]